MNESWMERFFNVCNAIFIIQTKFGHASWSHSLADLRDGENHVNFRNCLNILVPNKFILAKLFNDIVHEWFVAASDSLLVKHKFFAELSSFCWCKTLILCGLAGEYKLLWFVFTRFKTIFGYLNFVSCPNTYEGDFCVIEVSFPFFKLFL